MNRFVRYKIKPAVITDIDGILAQPNKGEYQNQKPIISNIEGLRQFAEKDHKIIILANRPFRFKSETVAWLKSHKVPCHQLIMKLEGSESLPPDVWKKDHLELLSKEYKISLVAEINPPTKKVCKELGLPVKQEIVHD